MTMLNHVAGGTVFTAFFGALLFGINILASPFSIVATIIASVLPDIDHTKSWIGKCCYPLAKWINRRYGHRTITHGFPMMIAVIVLSSFIEGLYFEELTFSTIIGLGYLSHITFDMCTLQGVPALYPFNKSPFILIGNPENRIRTGDYRGEAIAFSVFLMWGVVTYSSGLVQKGFWTTYNQAFATLQHLNSEFRRADDLLKINYKYKVGTEVVNGSGYCIESAEKKATVLHENGKWLVLDDLKMTILETMPVHTGKRFGFKNLSFINIGADSLNQLAAKYEVRKIDVVANQEFLVSCDGVGERSKAFKADYVSNIIFQTDQIDLEQETFIRAHSPRIETLRRKLETIRSDHGTEVSEFEKEQSELRKLQSNIQTVTGLFEKEKMQRRIKELKSISQPNFPASEIRELETQIRELRSSDRQRNFEKQKELESKYLEALPEETVFTGVITRVYFQETKS